MEIAIGLRLPSELVTKIDASAGAPSLTFPVGSK